jgi:hypothetical protein
LLEFNGWSLCNDQKFGDKENLLAIKIVAMKKIVVTQKCGEQKRRWLKVWR